MPRFFGEFLIASGEIDYLQLQQALTPCDRVNLRIGAVAVREGWMNADPVRAVLKSQLQIDRRFGETAVAMDQSARPCVTRKRLAQWAGC